MAIQKQSASTLSFASTVLPRALAQGLGDADRQAPRHEEGDRGADAPVGRAHASHMGLRHRVPLDPGTSRGSSMTTVQDEMGWSLSGQIGPVFTFTIGSAIEGDSVEGDITSQSAINIGFTSGGETLIGGSDTVAGKLTTSSVNVPVGSPVTIALTLTLGGFGSGTAIGDFFHSFDFPLTNIFTLPDGFTVNDPDMFIVNNDFLAPTAATPLPAALPLFASGAGVFGFLGWRRKKKAVALAA
jgi:hypothetical protein